MAKFGLLESAAAIVTKLGAYRDGGILLTGLIYALGYAVWSYSALEYELGPLPALDSQYFAAGIAPFICICIGILAYRVLKFTIVTLRSWSASSTSISAKVYRMVVLLAFWMAFLTFFLTIMLTIFIFPGTENRYTSTIRTSVGLVWFISVFVLFISMILIPPEREPVKSGFQGFLLLGWLYSDRWAWLSAQFLYLYAALVSAVLVGALYVEYIYIKLPQELGGFKPRCAQIELDSSKVSDKTLRQLLPNAIQSDSVRGLVRTKAVKVVYATTERIVFVPGLIERSTFHQVDKLEVEREIVSAMIWTRCQDTSPELE